MELRYNTTLEYQDAIAELVQRNLDMIELAKVETRSLNDNENEAFAANKKAIEDLEAEQQEFERQLEVLATENKLKNISIDRKMEKNEFSLLRAISEAYNKGEKTVDIKRAFQVTGMSGEGEDVVATDIWDVLAPLRAKNVLVAAGAQVHTGLKDNVTIPIYSDGNVDWIGEVTEAEDGGGSFSSVNLAPKRISGFFPISKQFLIQATPSAEARIREGISQAVWSKIEATLLGSAAGTANKPAGLLYNLEATEVADYAGLTELEADLKELNYDNIKAILSPRAEANFKAMICGTNNSGFVLDGSKLDGMDAEVTSRLASKKFLLGDFNQLVIGFWGNTEIQLIEDSYYAKRGQVCIVVNAYVDAKLARENAVVLGTTEVSASDGQE